VNGGTPDAETAAKQDSLVESIDHRQIFSFCSEFLNLPGNLSLGSIADAKNLGVVRYPTPRRYRVRSDLVRLDLGQMVDKGTDCTQVYKSAMPLCRFMK